MRLLGPSSFVSGTNLCHTARSLRRTPWYAITAVGVIALSMALATTTFAIVDGVLFKPLPYPRAREMYRVAGDWSPEVFAAAGQGYRPGSSMAISLRDVEDLAAAVPSATFTVVAGGSAAASMGDLRRWAPYLIQVDARFFDVLGMRPLVGGFVPDDFQAAPGSVRAALISYKTWQTQLGGRADVVGQVLESGGPVNVSYRVAGVLGRDFLFPGGGVQPDALIPLVPNETQRTQRTARSFSLYVRLPSEMPLADVQARFNDVGRAGRAEIPDRTMNGGLGYWDVWNLRPVAATIGATQRATFATVFYAAAALLLLGCLNVSGLVAGRSADRRREIVLRRALGAGDRQIAGLVVAECGLLIAAGAGVGLAVSYALVGLVHRLLPPELGLLKDAGIDWRVIGFAVATSAIAVLFTALWPIRQSLRRSPSVALADGSQSVSPSRTLGGRVVISAQVAVGLILTVCGVLVVGSLVQVWRTDVGFPSEDLLVLDGGLIEPSTQARLTSLLTFLDDARAIPGVTAVGATSASLFRSGSPGGEFRADTYRISRGFFAAARLELIEGRVPSDEELDAKAPVAVVSHGFAAQYFPGRSAVGLPITTLNGRETFTVVGVVEDTRFSGWDSPAMGGGQFYRALDNPARFTAIVRIATRSAAVLPRVLELATRHPTVRLGRAAFADELLVDTIRPRRFRSWLFGSFALAALAILGVGVLGLVAMTTARRTREMGVRLALGATKAGIVRLLLREQLSAVVAGIAVGSLAAYWAVTLVKSYLYEITIYDPRAWAIAVAAIALVAIAGTLIPARRASAADPVRALRAE